MLNYIDIGEGDPILFLHGLGGKIDMWHKQYPLSEHYRLIVVELRGCGNSTITDNLNVETFADDIIELLDYLKLDKVHMCGLSLGGIVCLELHKRYKERIKSLILANTTFYIPPFIGYQYLKSKEMLINSIGYEKFAEHTMKKCLYSSNFDDELVSKCFLIREDTYLNACKSAFGRNYLFELSRIRVPTLIIGSTNDVTTPVFNAYTMNHMIKNSKLKVFNKCGHLSNIERYKEFNEEIDSFIRSD